MKKMITCIFLIALMMMAAGVNADPSVYSGVVSVDSVEAYRGDHFVVTVRLTANSIPVSGINMPLRYNSSDLSIDSVSFVGSLKPSDVSGGAYVNAEENTVRIYYIPNIVPGSSELPSFTDSEGILAKIHFKLDEAASSGTIPIDSINLETVISSTEPVIHFWQRIEFADNSGSLFYLPDYVPGAVIVPIPLAVEDDASGSLPTEFALSQNYPNPFNPSTIISFALPRAGHARLAVYNVLGQTVSTLLDRRMPAGNHEIEFDASDMPSGIYFYRLTHSEGAQTKKMILIK